MMLTGPDCSRHQGTVDWRAVAGAGHSFAIIKATEGTSYSYVDWWHRNAPQVEAAGLVLGAYHFLRSYDGAAQARYFASTVGSFGNRIAVLDVETAANGTKPNIDHVRQFAAEFRRLVPGHPLVIYTGRWYWSGVMGNPHGADLGPLWHSEYETSAAEVADGPESDRYGGWDGCTLWQWTSSGSCPGVSGRCDLNILRRGTLAALTGAAVPQPETIPPVQEDDDMADVFYVRREGSPDGYLVEAGTRVKFNNEEAVKAVLDERGDVRHGGKVTSGPRRGHYDALVWKPWHVDIYPPRRGPIDD